MKSWQGQRNDSSSDNCWKISECTLYALSHSLTLKMTFLLPQQQTEGLVPTSLCFRKVPMDPFQPKIQYIFKIILIFLILLTRVTILNQYYSTKIKAALTNIFCHGRGMALWMVMSICGSVQTEISQKLLDWLPWNFINAHCPLEDEWFWWSPVSSSCSYPPHLIVSGHNCQSWHFTLFFKASNN